MATNPPDKLRVSKLQAELEQATADLHGSDDWDTAYAKVLDLERKLAAAKGESYALTLDFPVVWDIGAPLPHVFANDWSVFLVFLTAVDDPAWDGSYAKVMSPSNPEAQTYAIVEFHAPESVRFGSPNEDVHSGHLLYGKGQEPYTAQTVENSLWRAEVEAINKVHPYYKAERWQRIKHYIFWFHDTTFECLAHSYEVKTYYDSMKAVFEKVMERLVR